MAKRVDHPAITNLLNSVGAVVEARGFQRVLPPSVWTGKHNVASWSRTSWKTDTVRLGWRKPPIASYFLDAQWCVPRADGGLLPASGINAGYRRRGLSDRRLPDAFEGSIDSHDTWVAEIVRDAQFAVEWCDSCSTRDGALAELARADRNGPGVSSEAYRYLLDYVRLHAEVR